MLIQSNLLEKLLKEYSISLFTRNWLDPALDGILSMSVHTNATDFGAHTDQQSERDYLLGVRVPQRNADIRDY